VVRPLKQSQVDVIQGEVPVQFRRRCWASASPVPKTRHEHPRRRAGCFVRKPQDRPRAEQIARLRPTVVRDGLVVRLVDARRGVCARRLKEIDDVGAVVAG
jgi:hypothetical protein